MICSSVCRLRFIVRSFLKAKLLFVLDQFNGATSEEVYLRGYDSVSEACASIGQYLTFYNGRRPQLELY